MTSGPNHALLHFHRFNKVSFAPSSWCEQVKQGVTPAMFRQTGCITSPMWSEFNPQCLDILISCLNLLSWLHSRMSKGGVESSWRLSWFCHLYPTFCLSLPTAHDHRCSWTESSFYQSGSLQHQSASHSHTLPVDEGFLKQTAVIQDSFQTWTKINLQLYNS